MRNTHNILAALLLPFVSDASKEMQNFRVVMKNLGAIKYDVKCMQMNDYYTLTFPVNANVDWDLVPHRLVPSSNNKMICETSVFGGSAFHERNKNQYGCLGRCGPGCSNVPAWRDMSAWSLDCLKHDICSYYFSDASGSSVDMCKDALISAADDFVFPVCMKKTDETIWSRSQSKQDIIHGIICDGIKVQPGGTILLEN